MPLKDIEARRVYHRDYMRRKLKEDPEFKERHRKRVRDNDRRYRSEVDKVVDHFRETGCRVCGEPDPCCLVAHHLDPSRKEFNIGDCRRMKLSPTAVEQELRKCVCLCYNCHAKLHAGKIDYCGVVQPGSTSGS